MSETTATATTTEPTTGTTWNVDEAHTHVEFAVKHMMISTVKGRFGKVSGTVTTQKGDFSDAVVDVTIDATSLDTRQEQRDAHLRSADFFDVESFPELTFVVTGVERTDASTWRVTGDLTIKGVTNPVSIDFEATGSARDPFGNLRVGFEGSTSINRKDWGLTWNAALETGGVLVSEKIKLDFDVSAIAVPANN
jgi:polyisoprenoid-binding protein YceI